MLPGSRSCPHPVNKQELALTEGPLLPGTELSTYITTQLILTAQGDGRWTDSLMR